MEHICKENMDSFSIFYSGCNWVLGQTKSKWMWIQYCPYCGEKLEPPDVEIEVSKKAIEEVALAIWQARELLERLEIHCAGKSLEDAKKAIDAILGMPCDD